MIELFDQFRAHTGDSVSAAVLVLANVLSNQKMTDGSLTVAEAAEYLGIAKQTVYELVRTGQVRHHRIGRRRGIRFSQSDLDQFRQNAEREPNDLFAKHVRA